MGINMALDRWIAVLFLLLCLIYGYTAFFTMDGSLPPFMQRNPIWPSTLPKLLSVLGVGVAFLVLFSEPEKSGFNEGDIDYRNLGRYKIGHALFLMGLMVVYALSLRPIGFIISTTGFLCLGGYVLGERKFYILVPIAIVATLSIWYLVQEVLGIFLRPLPWFMGV
jgi:putative tricarboxylic transport membrane protein